MTGCFLYKGIYHKINFLKLRYNLYRGKHADLKWPNWCILTDIYIHVPTHKSRYKPFLNAICSNMDGHRDCHTKSNKSDGEGEISCDYSYM